MFESFKKHFLGDSWDERGNNLYGCLKQVPFLLSLVSLTEVLDFTSDVPP
jgi:hypothetical protein